MVLIPFQDFKVGLQNLKNDFNEYRESLKKIESKTKETIEKIKDEHPFVAKAIDKGIDFLPPPVDKIASFIWNISEGSEEDKTENLIEFLEKIEKQQEQGFQKTVQKLEQILSKLEQIEQTSAKQETVLKIKSILEMEGQQTIEKLDKVEKNIQSQLSRMEQDLRFLREQAEGKKQRKSGFEGFAEEIKESNRKIRALTQIYVKPKEYDKIIAALKKRKVAIITGSPEYGKTYTAYHILYQYYNEGFVPYHIKIRDDATNIFDELKTISEHLNEDEKIAVYLDDPFGQTEYNNLEDSAKQAIYDLIADFNSNQNNSILIITSRKYIFDKVKEDIVPGDNAKNTVITLDLKNESYDISTRKEFLEKCGKFHNASWSQDKRLMDFVKSKLGNYLPTMLNIWNFTQSYVENPNKDRLFELIKRHSVSTPKWFAEQIKQKDPEFMYFLSFPFISEIFKLEFIKKQYEDLVKNIEPRDYYNFDLVRSEFENEISVQDSVTFSHPSYSESLNYLLDVTKLKKNEFKIRDIFLKVLFHLVENKKALWGVTSTISYNFAKMPSDAQQILFNLAENEDTANYVAMAISANFDKIPSDKREELILKMAEKESAAGNVAVAVDQNFDKIPSDTRIKLLFKIVKKKDAVASTARAVVNNFDKIPSDTRIKLLFKTIERESTAFHVAFAVGDNFNKLTTDAQNILFKLAEKESTAGGAAAALDDNFDKIPSDTRIKLLFKLAEKESAAWRTASAVSRNFDNLSLDAQNILFKLAEKESAAEGVAVSIHDNFDKIPSDTRIKLLFKMAEKENAKNRIKDILITFEEKIPAEIKQKLFAKVN